MAGGYMGRLLFVDLEDGKIDEIKPDDGFCRNFIGGYGFGARLLYDRIPPGADPLGPENLLGFVTGPLTATPAIIGSRYVVVGKSPLTNTWGDANSGGYFGPALKSAGFDGVFFSGISEKPVYLLLDAGRAELRDAAYLWGKDSNETDDLLRRDHGKKARLACIGPSGESLSLISGVINDKGRAAGRSGLGAVMGSKRLKAVVCMGDLEVSMADPERAQSLRRAYLKTRAGFFDTLHQYGTAGITADSAMSGDSPVKNWGGAGIVDFPNAKAISDDSVRAAERRKFACWKCSVACGGEMESPSREEFAVTGEAHKPEYETLCAFGTNCLNDDLDSITKANEICNKAGLDTISAGAAVAFAIECYENGIISRSEADGLELTWGNSGAIVDLTRKMARREGIGGILADGVKVASEKIGRGSEAYAIHIGGQEVPMHDPKCTPGLATTYRLDATPARHTQGGELIQPPAGLSIGRKERTDYTGRGEDQRKLVDIMHVINAAGLCMFGFLSFDAGCIPDFLSAVTGWDVDMDECLQTGERIGTVRHLFNLRDGHNPLKLSVPGRVLGKPPLVEGNVRGIEVDEDTLVREYLAAVGWDPATTRPSRERIAALGLTDMQ